ncbi:MAG: hypothetical protein KC925_00820 [Candidatus Doudnabacteria bacterium]|nr:hypothetical protein [Candidatus Doudnabacteria bacterium]
MKTRKLITITVIVAAVLVLIAWLVTTLILKQREAEQDQATSIDTTADDTTSQAQLIPVDTSSETLTVLVEDKEGRTELFDGVGQLAYDYTDGEILYHSDIRGTAYRYLSGDEAQALAPDQVALQVERMDWRRGQDGEPDVLLEELGGETLIIRDAADFYYEERGERSFFYDDTSLLVHEDRGNGVHAFTQQQMADPFTENFDVRTDLAVIEDETIQSLTAYAFSGEVLFLGVETSEGRFLERLTLKTGERERVVNAIGRVWPSPSQSGVLVEVVSGNIETIQWVTDVAQPQTVTLPVGAQPIFSWDVSEEHLYVLTGEEATLEELSGTQTEVDEDEGEEGEQFAVLAEELWQVPLESNSTDTQRISTFETTLLVDTFFFDLPRKRLVYRDPLATSIVILQDTKVTSSVTGKDTAEK